MKNLILFTLLILTFAFSANAQTAEPEIPISRAAAIECDKCQTVKEALEAEVKTLKEAVTNLRLELERERGNVRAENEKGIEKDATIMRLTAVIDALIKNPRKTNKIALIAF